MASNAKFCSQCASPLPEPNPPFCSQCGSRIVVQVEEQVPQGHNASVSTISEDQSKSDTPSARWEYSDLSIVRDFNAKTAFVFAIIGICLVIGIVFFTVIEWDNWILVGIIFAVYWLPTLVAVFRKKSSRAAICLVNLFFGWTFLGWVVAIVWAVSGNSNDESNIAAI